MKLGGKLSQQSVANIENGIVKRPGAILHIAQALGVNAVWLQTEKGPKEAVPPKSIELAANDTGLEPVYYPQAGSGEDDIENEVEEASGAPRPPRHREWDIDVPVLGTAVGGDTTGDFELNGSIAFMAPRPPRFRGRRDIFAIITQGDSMSPWRERGQLVYIEGARPPKNTEHVLIEFKAPAADGVRPAILKKLVAVTPTKLKLLQYNPRREFEIDRAKVLQMLRVMETDELLGV